MRHEPEEETGELEELLRFGTVAEVDLERGRIRVDCGDVTSDWIRWAERRAGATRSWSPPTVGEQVMLFAPGGDLEGAIAIGGVSSDDNPPAGNSAREILIFGDGAELAYDPETHELEANLPAGAKVTINATGGVTIDASDGGLSIKGDVSIEGDVSITGTATAEVDVVGAGKSLKLHKHLGVTPGGGVSGIPQ